MPFSPGSLRSQAKARRASAEFAELVGRVIHATVSYAPIAFVEVDREPFDGFIGHAPEGLIARPLRLVDDRYLYLYQRLCLRRKQKYLATLEYRYTYQDDPDGKDWIFRYEYEREPTEPYPYAKAHVHVNAEPGSYAGGKGFEDLHLPTGRVIVEDVARHLVVEHGVGPISHDWEQILDETEHDFREIQRKRFQG